MNTTREMPSGDPFDSQYLLYICYYYKHDEPIRAFFRYYFTHDEPISDLFISYFDSQCLLYIYY